MNKEIFGNRLKVALDFRNINQRELALRTGLTEVSVSRYVNGARMPKVDVLYKICEALGVNADFLMGKTRGIKV